MPVVALWGAAGLVDRRPVRETWQAYAEDVRADAVPDCGHFLAEEQPSDGAGRILAFLAARRTRG